MLPEVGFSIMMAGKALEVSRWGERGAFSSVYSSEAKVISCPGTKECMSLGSLMVPTMSFARLP